jgi:hypothetical protein
VWFQNRRAKWRNCESRSQHVTAGESENGKDSDLLQTFTQSSEPDSNELRSPPDEFNGDAADTGTDRDVDSRTTIRSFRSASSDDHLHPVAAEEIFHVERCAMKSSPEDQDVSNEASLSSSCIKQELADCDDEQVKRLMVDDSQQIEEPGKYQKSSPFGSVRPRVNCPSLPVSSPSFSYFMNEQKNSYDAEMSQTLDRKDPFSGSDVRRERNRCVISRLAINKDENAFMQSKIWSQLTPLDLSSMTGCDVMRYRRGDGLPTAADELDADDPMDLRLRSLTVQTPAYFGM